MFSEYLLIASIGLIVGSFLSVVIYRLPNKESLWHPASHCPNCHRSIRWYHNVPIWGYAIQKGRCNNCKAAISFIYPLTEMISALVLCFMHYQFGWSVAFYKLSFLGLLLFALSVIDFRCHIIPNRIVFVGSLFALLFLSLQGTSALKDGLIGGIIGGGGFAGVWFLGRLIYKKDTMGGGDIKLAALLGLFLGWRMLLVNVSLVFVLIAIIGWAGILLRKMNRKSEIPMAPYFAIAAVISIYFGYDIMSWYLNFIHFH